MIAHLWTRHRWLLLGFVATVALALFFTVRAVVFTVYWSDHRDEAIAGWMTPRYIAMSWDVPPQVIGDALGITPGGDARRMTVEEYARANGVSVADVAETLATAIEAFRAAQ
jgi:hypothetical protein